MGSDFFRPRSTFRGLWEGKEKGKMAVVNPLLTTGLTRGMALPGAPETPPPRAQPHEKANPMESHPSSSSSPSARGEERAQPLCRCRAPSPPRGAGAGAVQEQPHCQGEGGREGDVQMLTCSVASPLLGPSSPSDLVSLTTPRAVSSQASLPWRREQCRESSRALPAAAQTEPEPRHNSHPTATPQPPQGLGHPRPERVVTP